MTKKNQPNIILIGFMGSGKSSVGRGLAHQLRFHFSDTDRLIEQTFGMPIHQIFDEKGEPFFRDLETKVCARLEDYQRSVIATGGGIISNPENRKYLQRAGFVIYLYAPLAKLLERLPVDGRRPLLKDPKVVEQRFKDRQPWYDALANYAVDTSNKHVEEVISHIVDVYNDRFSS
jgi:shikimate kinase